MAVGSPFWSWARPESSARTVRFLGLDHVSGKNSRNMDLRQSAQLGFHGSERLRTAPSGGASRQSQLKHLLDTADTPRPEPPDWVDVASG